LDKKEWKTKMTDNDKKVVKDSLNEMVDSMTRVAAERDLMKEISKQVKENTTVTPKVFRKMARVAYAANFAEEVAVHEEFEQFYKEIIGDE
jgi:hypothetical protein